MPEGPIRARCLACALPGFAALVAACDTSACSTPCFGASPTPPCLISRFDAPKADL